MKNIKIKVDYIRFFACCILFSSVFLIYTGAGGFYKGFHNADLGQNIRYINAEFGLELYETKLGTQDVALSGVDMYALGTTQMFYYNFVLALGTFLFGASSVYLIKK